MDNGVHEGSFLSQLLQQPIANADELFTVKCSAMSLFAAGADTVSFRLFTAVHGNESLTPI